MEGGLEGSDTTYYFLHYSLPVPAPQAGNRRLGSLLSIMYSLLMIVTFSAYIVELQQFGLEKNSTVESVTSVAEKK